ncbi:TRAP transporter substrate-binding protein [Bacillus sp. MRMR6]|uniref:TRAP transporter substrate-binding protein n=1 Tax=Bacillus sp. MRMR6 TaxID=1928617 RepID=UPI000952AF91|nr:TRAP transporter substrate-binding protein [Bacillus sp. MRMR6]OLS33582.1 hypothetical protein BTR25_25130 [Bacillus sp. MRMR6]
MKSFRSLALISLIFLLLITTACGNTDKTVSSNSSSDKKEQIVLKAGHNQVPDYPHGKIIHDFAKRVEELSNGHIKVEVFDNGSLGQEDQLFEGMKLGSIDMGKTSTSLIGTTVPSFQVFDLPYILRDSEHMWNVLNGDIGKQMLKELETKAGVKGLFWMDQGTRNFYTVDKPIRRPKDLEGLKIRSIQSPIMVDTINAFGGSATALPFGELYTAFKTHVVDGAENSPDALWYSKQYEVVKYYNKTEHFINPNLFMISMKTWNKLSAEDQKIVLEAGKQASEAGKALYEQEAAGLLEDMKKDGLNVITDVDKKSFEKIGKKIQDKYRDKIGGDLIDKVLAQ